MDRQQLSVLAHREHPIASPLAAASVDALLERVRLRPQAHVLDVGCGVGEWLVRILERNPSASGEGVDPSPVAIERARRLSESRLDPRRVGFSVSTIADFAPKAGTYDAVMCIGATHAFGGLKSTLPAVSSLLRAGGVAIVGDGFWTTAPPTKALEALGCASADDFADLASTIAMAQREGFHPIYAHVSSQSEWDDYEFSWSGSLFKYANEFPNQPDTADLQAAAEQHLEGYLRGYRGVLGFVTLVLAPSPVRA